CAWRKSPCTRSVPSADLTLAALNSVLVGYIEVARRSQVRADGGELGRTQTRVESRQLGLELLPGPQEWRERLLGRVRAGGLRRGRCGIGAGQLAIERADAVLLFRQSCFGLGLRRLLARFLRAIHEIREARAVTLDGLGGLAGRVERFELRLFGGGHEQGA